MADSITTFFERVEAHDYYPHLQDVHATCHFHINNASDWSCDIKEGHVTVHATGKNEPEDCGIALSKEDFQRMLDGQMNPVAAFLQGKIAVTGSIGLAQICMRDFLHEEEVSRGEQARGKGKIS